MAPGPQSASQEGEAVRDCGEAGIVRSHRVGDWIPVPMSFVGPGLAKPKEIRDTKALWWGSCHLYT